jgi:hypothetical protein
LGSARPPSLRAGAVTAARTAQVDVVARLSSRWLQLGVVGACLTLAGLSLLLPYTLSGDEWCWLIWGRDIGRLALDTTGCLGLHVWKPLPPLFTTVIAQTGDAAPILWLLLVRTSWLLALVLAYRVGTRLGGARLAGVVAALGLLLIPNPDVDWIDYVRHASSEPLIVAAILAAIDRHLAGHRIQALGLGCLAALGRPEAWLVVVAYGALLWRAGAGRRLAVAALVAAVPLLWLGGGAWGGSGPVSASRERHVSMAKSTERAAGQRPAETSQRSAARRIGPAPQPPRRRGPSARLWAGLGVVVAAAQLVVLPLALLALAALVRACIVIRRNGSETDRVTAFLGIGALGWIAVQAVAGLLGFPVASRFLFGPAAVISVLAGVGVAETRRALGLRLAATIGLVALIAASAAPRVEAIPARLESGGGGGAWPSVIAALRRAKDQGVLNRCGTRIFAVGTGGRRASEIPWSLDVPARAVRPLPTDAAARIKQGIVVIRKAGHVIPDPTSGTAGRGGPRGWRQLAGAGKWSVWAVGCRSLS